MHVAGDTPDPDLLLANRFGSGEQRLEQRRALRGVLIHHILHNRTAEAVGRSAACDRFPGGVQKRPPELAVDLEDDRRQIIYENTVPLLAMPQDFLGRLALMDVLLQLGA
jgi:hypothetical protein